MTPAPDNALAAVLQRLARDPDPRARNWAAKLLRGDAAAPPAADGRPPRAEIETTKRD
jgi:hypothetical protein